jgi:tetratricopeptide (TPR) repeat protein
MNDRNYSNPYGVHNMVLSYDINEHTSLLHDLSFPESESYEKIRFSQNKIWAEQRLLRGVEYAKEGKFKEALKYYGESVELVPDYAEAYTARGAAYIYIYILMLYLDCSNWENITKVFLHLSMH